MNVLEGVTAEANFFVCCAGVDSDCAGGTEDRVRGILATNWWFCEEGEAEWN